MRHTRRGRGPPPATSHRPSQLGGGAPRLVSSVAVREVRKKERRGKSRKKDRCLRKGGKGSKDGKKRVTGRTYLKKTQEKEERIERIEEEEERFVCVKSEICSEKGEGEEGEVEKKSNGGKTSIRNKSARWRDRQH